MTAFFDSVQAIISRFGAQWAAAHPDFPIVHDNEHYEPEEGSDFVYISVQFTGANAVSLGGPDTSLIRHAGLLEINFYTAIAKGTGLGRFLGNILPRHGRVERLNLIFRFAQP